MAKIKLNNIQDIHYLRQKPSFCLNTALSIGEFFYKNIINFKNILYEKNILKEKKVKAFIVCVGNLTTGGVGKTPLVTKIANEISAQKPVAIISRGYGAKISNKNPMVIKDFKKIIFKDGNLCGDEPYQLALKANENTVVIICTNRKKAAEYAIEKFKVSYIVMDDGFSNRKIKKDKSIVLIDSKMRFGNGHMLPRGPLREDIEQLKRADEIILVNKGDENIEEGIAWVKQFNKPVKICKMKPKRIYNMKTKADIVFNKPLNVNIDKNFKPKAIAFCAIGQPVQFFDFAKRFYNIVDEIVFNDHHKYTQSDIKKLTLLADKNGTNIFITTQKDETKLNSLISNETGYCFNVLELDVELSEII